MRIKQMNYDNETLNTMLSQTRKWCKELGLTLEIDKEDVTGDERHCISIYQEGTEYLVCSISIEGAYFWIQGYMKGIR